MCHAALQLIVDETRQQSRQKHVLQTLKPDSRIPPYVLRSLRILLDTGIILSAHISLQRAMLYLIFLCLLALLSRSSAWHPPYDQYGEPGNRFAHTIKMYWTKDVSWCPLGLAPIPSDSWHSVSRDEMLDAMGHAHHFINGAKEYPGFYYTHITAPKYRYYGKQNITILFTVKQSDYDAYAFFDYAGTIHVSSSILIQWRSADISGYVRAKSCL